MSTTTLGPTGDLYNTLVAAQSGDFIELLSGVYAPFRMDNHVVPGTGVTIQPAPGALPILSSWTGYNAGGLIFKNLEFLVPAGSNGVLFNGGSNITLQGLKIHGAPIAPYGGTGIILYDITGIVSVTTCEIYYLGSGLGYNNCDHPTFTDNNLHDLDTDGIFGASSNVLVARNRFRDFTPNVGDHPDAIQFWGFKDGSQTQNILIIDNVIQRGKGQPIQGIFIEYANGITITGNAMTGTMYNGISLSGSNNAKVDDNFVQGYSDMGSWIIFRGSTICEAHDNTVTQPVIDYPGTPSATPPEPKNVGVSIGVNLPIALGDPADPNLLVAMTNWLAAKGSTVIPTPTPIPIPVPTPTPVPPTPTPPVPVVIPDPLIADLQAQLVAVKASLDTAVHASTYKKALTTIAASALAGHQSKTLTTKDAALVQIQGLTSTALAT